MKITQNVTSDTSTSIKKMCFFIHFSQEFFFNVQFILANK